MRIELEGQRPESPTGITRVWTIIFIQRWDLQIFLLWKGYLQHEKVGNGMIFRAWRGWAPRGRFLCSSAGCTKLFGCHWGLAVCSNGEWQYSSNILWLGNQINDSHTCCQSTWQPLRAVKEAHVRRHLPSWGLQLRCAVTCPVCRSSDCPALPAFAQPVSPAWCPHPPLLLSFSLFHLFP